MTSADFW